MTRKNLFHFSHRGRFTFTKLVSIFFISRAVLLFGVLSVRGEGREGRGQAQILEHYYTSCLRGEGKYFRSESNELFVIFCLVIKSRKFQKIF